MSELQTVKYAVEGGVGVIAIDNPPVNALGPGVREGIMAALAEGIADPAVEAFVLIGIGRNFMAGADIRQFGGARPVSTRTSAAAIAASGKPVVAAIHGYALGGGLEHALACHYRIASPGAKVGLPEVSIGIVPAGGGTQRLTRLIGPRAALDVILSSRHVEAKEALGLGIVDEIVEADDLQAAAVQYARRIAAVRPMSSAQSEVRHALPPETHSGVFEQARKSLARTSRHLKAPQHAVALIEAATTASFEDGVALEQKLFAELENADEARALRYAFFAEREAAKVPGASALPQPAPVRSAAVVGGGTMGGGIAMAYADSGVDVKILDVTQDALERGMKRIRDNYAVSVKRGSITQEQMDARLAKIHLVTDYADIGNCDAVIEAVFERVDLKQEVFAKLDAVMKPGALLLTNSSAIDIDIMANATKRPQDVVGAHFFAPANVMKLCEVVRGSVTLLETIARTMKMARDLGKVGAVAGSCDGFAANRSRTPMMSEMRLELVLMPCMVSTT
jgi:3-hydroxyacyl-CoA dehydrogenase